MLGAVELVPLCSSIGRGSEGEQDFIYMINTYDFVSSWIEY